MGIFDKVKAVFKAKSTYEEVKCADGLRQSANKSVEDRRADTGRVAEQCGNTILPGVGTRFKEAADSGELMRCVTESKARPEDITPDINGNLNALDHCKRKLNYKGRHEGGALDQQHIPTPDNGIQSTPGQASINQQDGSQLSRADILKSYMANSGNPILDKVMAQKIDRDLAQQQEKALNPSMQQTMQPAQPSL